MRAHGIVTPHRRAGRLRRALILALALPAALALLPRDTARASEPSAQTPGAHLALVADGAGDGGASLAATLEDAYGFDVTYLGPRQATRGALTRSLGELLRQASPGDQLVLYLNLPVETGRGLRFVPADGDRESPWTLLSDEEIGSWLGEIPAVEVLLTLPACGQRLPYGVRSKAGDDLKAWWTLVSRHPMLQRLEEEGRRAPVTAFLVCDLERERRERRPDGASGLWGSDAFARSLARALRSEAVGGAGEAAATALAHSAVQGPGTFDLAVLTVPRSAPEFRLLATAEPDALRHEWRGAISFESAQLTMERISALAAAEPGANPGLVALLREIALDPEAGLPRVALEGPEAVRMRSWAIEVLGQLESTAARDALVEVAAGATVPAVVRNRALGRIARFESPRTEDRSALRAALGDPDPSVRWAAVRSLAVSGHPETAALLRAVVGRNGETSTVILAALQELSALGRQEDRDVFVDSLEHPDEEVRREATAAVGRLGPSAAASEALAQRVLTDPNPDVRQLAALSLGRVYVEEARDVVLEVLTAATGDDRPAVAAAAATSLGRLGGPEAEALLRDLLLADPPEEVAVATVEALGQLGAASAVPELTAKAAAGATVGLRRAAVSALGAIGTPAAIEALSARADDEDPYVRAEARRQLESRDFDPSLLAQEAAPDEVREKSDYLRGLTYQKSAAYLDERTLAVLLRGLGDPDPTARAEAVDSLVESADDPQVAERVAEVLLTPDAEPVARRSAAEVLGEIHRGGNDLAVEALATAARDPSSAVRSDAVRALGRRIAPEAVGALLEAARDPAPSVRRLAALSLGPFADTDEVRGILERMAKGDPSPEVQEAAIQALNRGVEALPPRRRSQSKY